LKFRTGDKLSADRGGTISGVQSGREKGSLILENVTYLREWAKGGRHAGAIPLSCRLSLRKEIELEWENIEHHITDTKGKGQGRE